MIYSVRGMSVIIEYFLTAIVILVIGIVTVTTIIGLFGCITAIIDIILRMPISNLTSIMVGFIGIVLLVLVGYLVNYFI